MTGEGANPLDCEVIEIGPDDSGVDSEILHHFYEDYLAGKLELPPLPDLAFRVRRAIQDPSKGGDDIARLIRVDPSLAARLVKVVNSPLYRGRDHATSTLEAVTRLGLGRVRNLVFSFTVGSLFRSRSRHLNARLRDYWRHSQEVASLSFVLARLTPGLDPDKALLAGLLHDIGAIPILQQIDKHRGLVKSAAEVGLVLQRLKGKVGALLLSSWDFPHDLVLVAEESENWHRDSRDLDYCDLVIIAQLHSYIGTPRMQHLPRLDQVPAFAKLANGELSPRLSLAVLDNAHAEIEEVKRTLLG